MISSKPESANRPMAEYRILKLNGPNTNIGISLVFTLNRTKRLSGRWPLGLLFGFQKSLSRQRCLKNNEKICVFLLEIKKISLHLYPER